MYWMKRTDRREVLVFVPSSIDVQPMDEKVGTHMLQMGE
jgi:hypothetical protein